MSEELAVIEEPPKRGTLAWLQLQEHVLWEGVEVPAVHRIPDGALRHPGDDDGRCRVVWEDGRRCGATRMRAYGICSAHAGGGDPQAASERGHAKKAVLRQRRALLGIGPNTAANPRQIARLAALGRAEEIAAALVDGPLDDASLSAVERQQAVIRTLSETFPLQQLTVEVELPADAAAVSDMGWEAMQQLAGRLLAPDTA
jgi:hypothetical protein